jgi:hypothetical protein
MIKALIGWKGYVAAAALAGFAAWVVQGWRYDAKITRIERDQAVDQAEYAELSLTQLKADIDSIAAAGRRVASVSTALTAEINKITGALKNAPPLSDDCRPDPIRLRSLTDAVRAANRAAAGQSTGGTVPADP